MTSAIPEADGRRRQAGRWLAAFASAALLTSGVTAVAGTTAAQAAPKPTTDGGSSARTSDAQGSGFTPGDIVVYRVGDGSSSLSGSGSAVFLDEYAPDGTLVRSVPLPTAADGANQPLVASGSASSEGGLTLSGDGQHLVATGYDTALGTSGLADSAAADLPRTVASVDASGTVDSSTALTDFSDGNNPRSAVSQDGKEFWVGGAAGGVRYATLGASTSTSLVDKTFKNVRQLSIVGGQLYTSADPSKASVTVATVGTGLPTTATQPVTNLPFATSPSDPYSYALLTLAGPAASGTPGSAPAPDTLYVADNGAEAVVKYSLVDGSWVQRGSVPVPGVTGLTANEAGGKVSLYATSSGDDGTAGTLYGITDASGIGGTLTGTASVLADAPADEAFRGVALAPGTGIGSGGGAPAATVPTVAAERSGLPAALGDPGNPTLPLTVGDKDFPAADLKVTASSSDTSVAPAAGLSVTGTGAQRTLAVQPGAVGYSTVTVTVTAPDGSSASTQIQYGVSANLGDASQRYYSGAGNASAAIDVGGGYMVVADDESNVLRLYNETVSGPPVKTFDFTSQLPAGTAEADLETAARSGDTIYWGGSLSNNDDGSPEPSRSTLFATHITGSGADTQLSYVGGYTGLQNDLVNWDSSNGSGLGADYLGLADSAHGGIGGHESDALNLEGMEFAPSSTGTVYLTFRAPLEPTTDRHLALVVPLTNIGALTSGSGTAHAAFGAPILMNLGGLGIRDIRKNADGQYLIVAGTADGTNDPFVLYSWDGKPSDPPIATGTTLPSEPAGDNKGAWETIVSVPDPLTAGAPVRLVQDNGDTAWYGDARTSKSGLPTDLQKSLGQVFTYRPGKALATTTSLTAGTASPGTGQKVTYTATVSGPSGGLGTPTGTVAFTGPSGTQGCAAAPVDASGRATCTLEFRTAGSATVRAAYSGDPSYAPSSASQKVTVRRASTTRITVLPDTVRPGQAAVITVGVTPSDLFSLLLGGRVTVSVTDAQGRAVPCEGVFLPGTGGLCTVLPGHLTAAGGPYTVTASFAGNSEYAPSSTTTTLRVTGTK
jgi:Bacterial Ig-like domain (group 3)